MSNYFFDTSAVCKHYHAETGTNKVDRLLGITGSIFFISRLAFVEVHSVFAKKVRMGQLTLIEGESATRRFRADIARKLLRVIRLTAAHYRSAEKFVRRIGPTANLRTLDALQLAVALSLNVPELLATTFVCADLALCAIAANEGLTVVNPEIP